MEHSNDHVLKSLLLRFSKYKKQSVKVYCSRCLLEYYGTTRSASPPFGADHITPCFLSVTGSTTVYENTASVIAAHSHRKLSCCSLFLKGASNAALCRGSSKSWPTGCLGRFGALPVSGL